jgi:hypothetical protein
MWAPYLRKPARYGLRKVALSWLEAARSKRREAPSYGCVPTTSNQLNGSVTERSEDRVDSGLIPNPLRLEPIQYILIHAQRNGRLGRQGLQTLANHTTHNVLYVSLWVL